eukprot:2016086-Amphidinium_carterae.1
MPPEPPEKFLQKPPGDFFLRWDEDIPRFTKAPHQKLSSVGATPPLANCLAMFVMWEPPKRLRALL